MRAVRFDKYGDYDELKLVDVPQPEPGPEEVLVKVQPLPSIPLTTPCVAVGWPRWLLE